MRSTDGLVGAWPVTLKGDLIGGLVSAVVALLLAMGYGMFAFGPLGDSYFAYGALAGLYAAVVAGFVCVVLGERTTTVYAPRITTTFFLGALLFDLVQFSGGIADVSRLDLILLASLPRSFSAAPSRRCSACFVSARCCGLHPTR